ncbi:MAG TPA: hypothetical protein VGV15_17105 [Terriglobales bacterium]|nr:hypothetical protein [Terriglobales bacterium]
MSRDIKYIGMDVHKEAIVIAVAPSRVSTGLHAHAHLHPLRRQIAIKLLRFLAMR